MLEALRQATGGIVAKLFLGLLVISFGVWGASGAFVGGGSGEAIRVGDTRIGIADYRLAYQTRVNAIEQQMNQRITREQAKILGLDQSVTNQLVAGAVLDENARAMGLGISETQLVKLIGEDPGFKDASGRFSRERLVGVLRSVGMSEDAYVQNQQAVAIRSQLVSSFAEGSSAPDVFFAAFSQYQGEKRLFEYAIIDKAGVPPAPEPSETGISTYYEANKTDYVAPEYRKLTLVRLLAADIAKPEQITTGEIAAEYSATSKQYTEVEQRRIQQIAFKDAAAARIAADRLAAGTPAETILTELGRTEADADLGMLRKDQIPDKAIADAAFALALNAASGVIEGAFGPVVLRVSEIKPETVKPLAEVEAEIRNSLAQKKASDVLFDTHDKLEDERAAGDPLAEAAAKAGLKAVIIESVDANGNGPDGKPVAGIPEAAAVLAEAFKTDEGVEADPVNIGTEGFAWFEVVGITPERQKPASEVREAVRIAWMDASTAKMVEDTANAIRDRVAKGETFASVLAALLPAVNGVAPLPRTSAEMSRSDTSQDLSANAVETGFKTLAAGVTVSAGTQAPARIVLKVAKIIPGAEISPPADLQERINSQMSDDLVANLVADLQARQEVAINPAAIDAALQF